MTLATRPFMTLEEYLNHDPEPDSRSELVNGVLVEMGAENHQNVLIAGFLFVTFAQFVPLNCLCRGTEIVVSSQAATTRYPDFLILTAAGAAALPGNRRSLITLEMPAPQLVVEVVSPGEPGSDNYDRDYIHKRAEYAARGIPEYWLVDPDRQIILVLTLQNGTYQGQQLTGQMAIVSPSFPHLNLTAEQVLKVGQAGETAP